MQITPEIVLTVLSIIAVVVGGLAYIGKRQADARLEAARTELTKVKGAAEVASNDSQARLKKAVAEAEERKSEAVQAERMLQMMNKQIVINRQQQQRMDAQRKSAKEGYKTIRAVQNDTNTELSNLYNEHKSFKLEMVKVLSALPTQIAATNRAELIDFAKMMAGEIAIGLVEQFERQKIETTLHPFPDPDDPDWREEMVYPVSSDVTIRKEPRFWDNALLQKPCAKIAPQGEKLRIITGQMKDWVIVDKTAAGERCWGWLQMRDVRIGQAELVGSN